MLSAIDSALKLHMSVTISALNLRAYYDPYYTRVHTLKVEFMNDPKDELF